MTEFCWLHLTDLHLGASDEDREWPFVQSDFFEDLLAMHKRTGPWDLIAFTGDLTFSGDVEQFNRVDKFLREMATLLKDQGASPLPYFLAVPGNHDLQRLPEDDKSPILKLLTTTQDNQFWEKDFWNSEYLEFLHKRFANYKNWAKRAKHRFRVPECQPGTLPGDFVATIEKEDIRIGVLGLNTAYLQLTKADYKGQLRVDGRQFIDACGEQGIIDWRKRHHECMLLCHHPSDWLCASSRGSLANDIVGKGKFVLSLCGHRHVPRLESQCVGGTPIKDELVSPSLFGLKHIGDQERTERLHGYTVGKFSLSAEATSMELWPRVLVRHASGSSSWIAPDYFNYRLNESSSSVSYKRTRTQKAALRSSPEATSPTSLFAAASYDHNRVKTHDYTDLPNIVDHHLREFSGTLLAYNVELATLDNLELWRSVCERDTVLGLRFLISTHTFYRLENHLSEDSTKKSRAHADLLCAALSTPVRGANSAPKTEIHAIAVDPDLANFGFAMFVPKTPSMQPLALMIHKHAPYATHIPSVVRPGRRSSIDYWRPDTFFSTSDPVFIKGLRDLAAGHDELHPFFPKELRLIGRSERWPSGLRRLDGMAASESPCSQLCKAFDGLVDELGYPSPEDENGHHRIRCKRLTVDALCETMRGVSEQPAHRAPLNGNGNVNYNKHAFKRKSPPRFQKFHLIARRARRSGRNPTLLWIGPWAEPQWHKKVAPIDRHLRSVFNVVHLQYSFDRDHKEYTFSAAERDIRDALYVLRETPELLEIEADGNIAIAAVSVNAFLAARVASSIDLSLLSVCLLSPAIDLDGAVDAFQAAESRNGKLLYSRRVAMAKPDCAWEQHTPPGMVWYLRKDCWMHHAVDLALRTRRNSGRDCFERSITKLINRKVPIAIAAARDDAMSDFRAIQEIADTFQGQAELFEYGWLHRIVPGSHSGFEFNPNMPDKLRAPAQLARLKRHTPVYSVVQFLLEHAIVSPS